jgi:hypothetical protein
MATIRALVSTYQSTVPDPAARIVNVPHFSTDSPPNFEEMATDIAELFATYRRLPNTWDRVNCRLYDVAAAEPRPILAEATHTATGQQEASGPGEVAVCLSFYSERNLPRSRGRLYIGPWERTMMAPNVSTDGKNWLATLAQGLADIGGTGTDWAVYSPTDGAAKSVTNWWVDDEWDTIRSRGIKSTSRSSGTVGEI